MKCSGKVDNALVNRWSNFGGDPDHRLDTGIVFQIPHCWEIRKVVSTDCACATLQCTACTNRYRHSNYMTSLRHRPAIDIHDSRQTCLGGGMHGPSASSYIYDWSSLMIFANSIPIKENSKANDTTCWKALPNSQHTGNWSKWKRIIRYCFCHVGAFVYIWVYM